MRRRALAVGALLLLSGCRPLPVPAHELPEREGPVCWAVPAVELVYPAGLRDDCAWVLRRLADVQRQGGARADVGLAALAILTSPAAERVLAAEDAAQSRLRRLRRAIREEFGL